ncbi:hypothetical protein FRC16_008546 [Serendipita sp. 398]|nr:hypothetical protein FRC16_008546 [Serendipita sp. 398]
MRLTLFASIFATAVTVTLAAATVHPAEPSNSILPAGGALVSTNGNNKNPQALLKLEEGEKGTQQQKDKPQSPSSLTTTSTTTGVATGSEEPHHPVLVRRVTEQQARDLSRAYRSESSAARRAVAAHNAVLNDPNTHPGDIPSHTADRDAQQDIMTKADHKARGQLAHANMLRSQLRRERKVMLLANSYITSQPEAIRLHVITTCQPAANGQLVVW